MVLLAEDEGLVGLMVEDGLRDAGFDVLGPYAACERAVEALAASQPAAAVTDIRLGKDDCQPLLAQLVRRGIPTIILSGYSRTAYPLPYDDLPWLVKPCPVSDVVAALRSLLDLRRTALAAGHRPGPDRHARGLATRRHGRPRSDAGQRRCVL
jgi:two-component system, response regulator PdtaR